MHDRDASNYIYALTVLVFAGLAGLANNIGVLRADGQLNLSFLALAFFCLPVAIGLGWRLVTIIHRMYRGNRQLEKRIAVLWLLAMLCGLSGAVALAVLTSDADAMLDSQNDWIVYSGFSLFGASCLLAFVGSMIVGGSRDGEV